MSIVELIPLNKGNQIILDNANIITIGRTPAIGCLDNKISRNHAQLFLKADGTLWIKALHHNPTFYKTTTNDIVTLTKNKEYQLYNNDQFGLLPDEYFYRVSIKLQDKQTKKPSDQNPSSDSSTVPKSPVKENEISTIDENLDEEKSQPANNGSLTTSRTLPNWMSNSSLSTYEHETEMRRQDIPTTSVVKKATNTEERKTKALVYDDEDDDDGNAVASSTGQASTSSNNGVSINHRASSTTTDSTKRERCSYAESCYRTNLVHRQQVSHPGDPDWETKENDKNKTKPECPYGNECYRRNADHLNEYRHSKKRCIEITTNARSRKRKASEDDDDDDGLPDEYDYNDSFIDDEALDSDTTNDEEEDTESDGDTEWKPDKNARYSDETDENCSQESERQLTNREAVEFVKDSSKTHHGSVSKKSRREEEDDD